jgi:hypothetical protein
MGNPRAKFVRIGKEQRSREIALLVSKGFVSCPAIAKQMKCTGALVSLYARQSPLINVEKRALPGRSGHHLVLSLSLVGLERFGGADATR